jgi:ABC-2 type transport system permease protein
MSMRISQGGVPAWEVALSLVLLALASWVTLIFATRLFRVALLFYGKTWNLPEMLRLLRSDRAAAR